MPGMGTDYRVLATTGSTSGVVTDSDQTLGPFYNYGFRAMRLIIDRESDVGVATLAAVVEFKNQASGEWHDLLDHAGNQVAFNNWADTENDQRYIDLVAATFIPGPDTDGVLAVGNNGYFETVLPYEMRIVLTHGGTDISNTYNCVVEGYV